MRIALFVLGAAAIFADAAQAQFQMKGPGGFSFGGPPRDPNQIFDFLAKGRGYFLVSDTSSLREPLTKYAQDKGIADGKITREHFAAFNESMKGQTGGSGGFRGFGPPGGPGGPPSGGFPPGGPPGPGQEDAMAKLVEADFKNRDRNGDGKLNADEMPDRLKENLERYDLNKDGLIDLAEYRAYMALRMGRDDEQKANPIVILVEEDLDQRPTVFRVGKMPKELPKWFAELDTDGDGQIALYEWRKGGKNLEEFAEFDRNEDGLITPEEVLRKLNLTGTAVASGSPGSGAPTIIRGSEERRGPPGGGGFSNFFKRKGGGN